MSVSIETPSQVASNQKPRTRSDAPYKAWVAKAPKQPMVLETVDLGPLGAEDVEVAVETCGLCHSDVSVFNNDWGISQYPAILGHEVTGHVTAVGRSVRIPNESKWASVWESGGIPVAACIAASACREAITFARRRE